MNQNPSQNLHGKELEDGWKVVEMITPPSAATGASFCTQYIVEKDKRRAFMKALDFTRVHSGSRPWTEELQLCLEEYHFEKGLYEKCAGKKMSRVVVPLGHGFVDSGIPSQFPEVPYIIFEMADVGDLRQAKAGMEEVDAAWALWVLYSTALGVFQLHQAEIAHQDLKPSNVLIFKERLAKVSDLGRASDKNHPFHFDKLYFAGDVNYAPIEIRFGVTASKFDDRYGFDLYMLGSMIFYHFTSVPLNGMLIMKCRDHGVDFRGMSFSEALPYLERAFYQVMAVLNEELSKLLPAKLCKEIVQIAEELCFPDPERRGLKGKRGSPSATDSQRYVGKLHTLAKKASMSS